MKTINGIKNITKREMRKAYAIAHADLPTGNIDKRTRIGKIAIYLKTQIDRLEVLEKRRKRLASKHTHINIFGNSLVIDYNKNKHDIKFISPERIAFLSGRNHWAKSQRDSRILNILTKRR